MYSGLKNLWTSPPRDMGRNDSGSEKIHTKEEIATFTKEVDLMQEKAIDATTDYSL